jgi:hypothetical protein
VGRTTGEDARGVVMFKVNKRLMLCAAVGGDVSDYEKMVPVFKGIHVEHPHMDRSWFGMEPVPGKSCTDKPEFNTVSVILDRLTFENEIVGYVGRCEECGAIFYREGL